VPQKSPSRRGPAGRTAGERAPARERILETAGRLFYRDGFHAVGIDTIIAESGIAKMTLYRHFPSKDALIAAHLERSNARFWDWLEGAIAGVAHPRARLVGVFRALEKLATTPQCFGCTFQGAAAEFPEMAHPGHKAAAAHKQQVLRRFAGLAREARLRNPGGLARQLLLLMDGAWVAARMFGPGSPAKDVARAAEALIDAHARDG
jgi:AcrR family transcriptional regulator